jgi:hypothetical protein
MSYSSTTTTSYNINPVAAPKVDASWGAAQTGTLNNFVSSASASGTVEAGVAAQLMQSLKVVYDGNKRILADLDSYDRFLNEAERNLQTARTTSSSVQYAAPTPQVNVQSVHPQEIADFENRLRAQLHSYRPQPVQVVDESQGLIHALLSVLMINEQDLRVNERVRFLLTRPYFEYIWNYLHYRPTRVVNPPVKQPQVVAPHHHEQYVEPVPIAPAPMAVAPTLPPWSGLELTDSATGGRGARVYSVNHGGPAHRAGLNPDDLIVSFNDRRITCKGDFGAAMSAHQAGDTVVVGVSRDGRTVDYQLTLDAQPRGFSPRRMNSYRVGYGSSYGR